MQRVGTGSRKAFESDQTAGYVMSVYGNTFDNLNLHWGNKHFSHFMETMKVFDTPPGDQFFIILFLLSLQEGLMLIVL